MKKKILIVVADYYKDIASSLINSAKFYLKNKSSLSINFVRVPGVFEIPITISKNMILVTRSRKKVVGLDGYGIKIAKQEILK